MPTQAPRGTVYLTPDGVVYRLRDYSIDWAAEPFTGRKDQPSYTVMRVDGATSTVYALPADATQVWSPTQ